MQDPLHAKTLKTILESLVNHFGWKELGERIPIKCFNNNASISSSLVFLRKTPWARKKIEVLYLSTLHKDDPEHSWSPIDLGL